MRRFTLFFKGMAMGVADLIPGVSGGTLALILDIYPNLIAALASLSNPARLHELGKREWKKLFQAIQLPFLLPVGLGILASIIILSKPLHWALVHYPPVVWSFFFALILASSLTLASRPAPYAIRWDRKNTGLLILGFAVALTVTVLWQPDVAPPSLITLFFHASIAISAMLLPGISGSTLLVLLGSYETIISAIDARDIITLVVFGAGCMTGILLFARLLHLWMQRRQEQTLVFLIGVMLGALPRVWPWQNALGEILSPKEYAQSVAPAYIFPAIITMLLGASAILSLELYRRMAAQSANQRSQQSQQNLSSKDQ